MNASTLKEIFETLDNLDVYTREREEGYIPFVLLDGHQSRFSLEFLEYINNSDHKWNVCIGVPNGTAYWQVGDSSEQNGTFKMSFTRAKQLLFELRLEHYQQSLHLMRTDIIPLINTSWPDGFANVKNNKKAIAERGWYPYNRNLLLNPVIRATMTEEMIRKEKEDGLYPYERLPFDIQNNRCEDLNFNGGGMAVHCATVIMSEVDRQKAREINMKRKSNGDNMKEKLTLVKKKLTAGSLVSVCRKHHLDGDVFDYVKKQNEMKNEVEYNRKRRKDITYLLDCERSDKAKEKNKDKKIENWNITDLKTYLKPMKPPSVSAIPTEKEKLIECSNEWISKYKRREVDKEIVIEYKKKRREGIDKVKDFFKEENSKLSENNEKRKDNNNHEEEDGVSLVEM